MGYTFCLFWQAGGVDAVATLLVALDRNPIGNSWHSAEHSGLWNGLCARQNGYGIAKKEKLRKYGNQILVIWGMSVYISRSIARRVSHVGAIGFRGSTMSHSFKKNAQTTRRILLQTAIGAVWALSFLGLTARGAKAAKSSKSEVAYQDSPKGNQQCGGCGRFIPPNACKQVDGVISPSGWCKMWAKKAA